MDRVVGSKTKVAYPLAPRAEIGRGVEGRVYRAGDRCVKVLTSPLSADQVEKIEALANLGLKLGGVAWPIEVVTGGDADEPTGFVMELAAGETLESLLDARATASIPVEAKVTIALGLARTVADVHAHRGPRVVLGDVLKAGNLVVDVANTSTMLVDAASVSVFGYRIASGEVRDASSSLTTPGYVPREVLDNPRALPSHDADRFALAVLLFELLFGKPPHEPRPSPQAVGLEPDDAVRRGLFFRWAKHPDFEAPRYDPVDLPDEVDRLFRAAFLATAIRPTAADWAAALEAWLDDLTPEEAPPDVAPAPAPTSRLGALDRAIGLVAVAWILLTLAQWAWQRVMPGAPQPPALPAKALGPRLFPEIFE